ncbi:MAG: aminoglycoside phosphotransferase family protein [Azospirillaceae bacterium]|nr:aminoglycoside phosphotransferase family protein [Azospirillaceae bacterium]
MRCSTVMPPEATDTLAESATRLLGTPVLGLEHVAGGGNNRLYRITTATGAAALKCYDSGSADAQSHRLEREFGGLRFLEQAGETAVPRALAADTGERLGLYQWIDGVPAARDTAGRDAGAIEQAVAFVARLHTACGMPGADTLGEAAESCLAAINLTAQIRGRLDRLKTVAEAPDSGEPELAALLEGELWPTLVRAAQRLHRLYDGIGLRANAALPHHLRTLSPSDFGFHNAITQADGRLVFIDFEYFGWDDPVKLAADFLWHPAMTLTVRERDRWWQGMAATFAGDDAAFPARLSAQLPLYGLRWALIMLNEFLPDRWQRRVYAGTTADWPAAKAAQLRRAGARIAAVAALLDSMTDAGDDLDLTLLPSG